MPENPESTTIRPKAANAPNTDTSTPAASQCIVLRSHSGGLM
jgi:hypothetical protein